MRIRSVTIGTNVSYPLASVQFDALARFQREARKRFEDVGLEVQTVRLATQPFPEILAEAGPAAVVPFARELEALSRAHGIDYCSIGPVVALDPQADLAYLDGIPAAILETESTFASALVAAPGAGIHLDGIQGAARVIANVAHSTPEGCGNLRFAVLANCPPGSPFFPAAYHRGPGTTFSIATEAADLAVAAFTQAETLEEARENLHERVREAARVLVTVSRALEEEFDLQLGGIDFSLAPYPDVERSIGQALEALGVEAFGGHATLFAVAFTTRVLREVNFPRCGFSGLMLPVLEDPILARRSAEEAYTLDSLLLYSAVCGTGLDTIPLPGDVAVEELAAILLDVAALAVAAGKPLTARLMPIPGKAAGDVTDFDFPYFVNARVLDVKGYGARGVFEGSTFVRL
jgi:hypothetical protein